MRLTTCVLLPCLHSWLQDLSVEKEEKENQIFQFAVIEVRERLLLGTHTQGTYIALRLSITFLGVDDPCLRQHMRILALRKNRSSWITVVTVTALRMADGIKTHTKCNIDYTHPSFLPVSFTWWLGKLYH